MHWLFLMGMAVGGVTTSFCLLCMVWVNAVRDIHWREHDSIQRTLNELGQMTQTWHGLTEENRRLRQRVRELEHELKHPEREEWGR